MKARSCLAVCVAGLTVAAVGAAGVMHRQADRREDAARERAGRAAQDFAAAVLAANAGSPVTPAEAAELARRTGAERGLAAQVADVAVWRLDDRRMITFTGFATYEPWPDVIGVSDVQACYRLALEPPAGRTPERTDCGRPEGWLRENP